MLVNLRRVFLCRCFQIACARTDATTLSRATTVNNSSFNHCTSTSASLSGQKRDSSGAPVHSGHGTSLFSYFKIRDQLRCVLNGFDALFA